METPLSPPASQNREPCHSARCATAWPCTGPSFSTTAPWPNPHRSAAPGHQDGVAILTGACRGQRWLALHCTTRSCRHRRGRGCSNPPPVHRRVPLGAGEHGEHVGLTAVVGDLTADEITLARAPPLLWYC